MGKKVHIGGSDRCSEDVDTEANSFRYERRQVNSWKCAVSDGENACNMDNQRR